VLVGDDFAMASDAVLAGVPFSGWVTHIEGACLRMPIPARRVESVWTSRRRPRVGSGGWWGHPPPPGYVGWTDPVVERVVLVTMVAVAAVAGLVLMTGHVSALVFAGGWPRYEAAEIPSVLWRFVASPDRPARAWEPVNHGRPVPGPVAWRVTFAVLALATAGPAVVVVRRTRR
jgi:hypothetical protein